MFDQESVLVGLIAGFLIAGIIGNILQRITKARRDMGAPDRSMTVPTAGTPRGVMANAARAMRSCFIWTLTLILVLLIAGGVVYFLLVILAG